PNNMEALWVYTAGTVRQVFRTNLGKSADGPDPLVVVVQAPINDGDHGGPVLDEHGELVAVTCGKDGPQQLVSYCIAVTEVKGFLADARPHWDPHSASDHQQRGRHYRDLQAYDRAVADFSQAIRLEPARATAYSDRGE